MSLECFFKNRFLRKYTVADGIVDIIHERIVDYLLCN